MCLTGSSKDKSAVARLRGLACVPPPAKAALCTGMSARYTLCTLGLDTPSTLKNRSLQAQGQWDHSI